VEIELYMMCHVYHRCATEMTRWYVVEATLNSKHAGRYPLWAALLDGFVLAMT